MKIVVLKFGGTSVGNIERIKKVAKIITTYKKKKFKVIVVSSAMSGITNDLIKKSQKISSSFDQAEYDTLLASGEQISCALIAGRLNEIGYKSRSWLSWQIPIITNGPHKAARIAKIDKKKILKYINSGGIPIITGFQGIDDNFRITTLGRGGTDASAIMIAKFFDATNCVIYTDVEGVYTTDPNLVKNAKKIPQISYEEMLELASQGAKVLQTRSVELAMRKKTKLSVRSSIKPNKSGTLVTEENSKLENNTVSGIAYSKDEAKITLSKVLDKPGVSSKIFGPLSKGNINVDMILQNVSQDGKYANLSFTLPRGDLEKALKILKKEKSSIGYRKINSSNNISKISVVGVGMRSHAGVAQTLFETLGKNKINIQVITTSEIKISILIDDQFTDLAVQKLHQAYKLHK